MTLIEKFEQEAYEQNVSVDYINFKSNKLYGLYIDGSIALKTGMTSAKTADTLAEELEHHYTSTGNILDQTQTINRKQERLARLRAYDRRIGLSGIIQGAQRRCQNKHELADFLEVSEEFLTEALECYKEKYGLSVKCGEYTIIFEPNLTVIESFI